MALKTCHECGSRVSSQAKLCPRCGAPVRPSSFVQSFNAVVKFVVLIGCVWVFWLFVQVFDGDTLSGNKGGASAATTNRATLDAKGPADVKRLIAKLRETGIGPDVIVGGVYDRHFARLAVANSWHYEPYQIRFQAAQNIWKLWAVIHAPDDMDMARVKLVDLSGNAVGGSRALAGALIWATKD